MKKKTFPIIFVGAAAILLVLVLAAAVNRQGQIKPADKLTVAASIFRFTILRVLSAVVILICY